MLHAPNRVDPRIVSIGIHIPARRVSNADKLAAFGLEPDFLRKKLGIFARAEKDAAEDTSDLCVKAFGDLVTRANVVLGDVEFCCVVTQNPDRNVPHTAAIVHEKLGLSRRCMTFDISQGCAGFVHAIALASAHMERFGLHEALVFTCDPYSKIVDPNDKGTALIFGDAATVTLLRRDGAGYSVVDANFGTEPATTSCLHTGNKTLTMDGAAVLFHATHQVPDSIRSLLEKNHLTTNEVDLFLLHPGSKRVVDMIQKALGVESSKVPFEIAEIGNTVSSSIPLVLQQHVDQKKHKLLLLSGFGVGFSWGTCLLRLQQAEEGR